MKPQSTVEKKQAANTTIKKNLKEIRDAAFQKNEIRTYHLPKIELQVNYSIPFPN
jgi:hypothetical protein